MPIEKTIQLAAFAYLIAAIISFFVALLIKGIYVVINFFRKEDKEAPQAEALTGLTPEVIAAITAAATLALKKHVRVGRVRYWATPESAWSRHGRVSIMTSHQVKR